MSALAISEGCSLWSGNRAPFLHAASDLHATLWAEEVNNIKALSKLEGLERKRMSEERVNRRKLTKRKEPDIRYNEMMNDLDCGNK